MQCFIKSIDMQWNWYHFLLRHDQGVDLQGTEARVGSSSAPQTPVTSEGRVYHREDISASPSESNVRVTQEISFEGSPRRTPPTSPSSLNEPSLVREQTPFGRSSKRTPPVPPKKKYVASPGESSTGLTPIPAGKNSGGYSSEVREHLTTFDTPPRRTPPKSPKKVWGTIEITERTLIKLSSKIPYDKVELLGFGLGFTHVEIFRYKASNTTGHVVTYDGTHRMLQEWFQRTRLNQAHVILGRALIDADLLQLKEEYCGKWSEALWWQIERWFVIKLNRLLRNNPSSWIWFQ